MSISNGIYRVAQAIKWDGRVLGGLWFFALAYSIIIHQPSEDKTLLLISALVFVGITEGVAWILEGFGSE